MLNTSLPYIASQRESRRRLWPRRIGILNDYIHIPYANGSSFASQHLYRLFKQRGHEVTVLGPADQAARADDLPDSYIAFPSVPLRNHPGVRLPLPSSEALKQVSEQRLDITLGQTGSAFLEAGIWLRYAHRVPFLCVNTIHLPSVYNVMLPSWLHARPEVRKLFSDSLVPWIQSQLVQTYNRSDGLIVLCRGLRHYWREQGVTAPIHVIPRAIEPKVFDGPSARDPFCPSARRGYRLLVVCRHTREKSVDRLLRIFAKLVVPAIPEATLTLVGDGPEHDELKALTEELRISHKTHFTGEQNLVEMATWYRHADLFVYTSLSETYGQVVSEALWCGKPVVAFDDGMGVAEQLHDAVNGHLVPPGPDENASDWRFANAVASLLKDPQRRATMAEAARRTARERCDPEVSLGRYYEAFSHAKEHIAQSAEIDRIGEDYSLSRWRSIQLLLGALGMLRRPVTVNRGHLRQPSWKALSENQAARSLHHGASTAAGAP